MCVALGLALANITAVSDSAFPLDVSFTPVSLNGGDFYAPEWQANRWLLADRWPNTQPLRPPTFSLHYNATRQEYVARGYSGCNWWSMKVDLLPKNRLVFTPVASYSLGVPCDVMKSERRYISVLRRVTRWRMDADALILEGDGNIIRFDLAHDPM